MKKAKVMLGVVAVLAIVGGSLAFKAQKFNGTFYCATTSQVEITSTQPYEVTPAGGSILYCTPSAPTPLANPNVTSRVLANG